MDAYLEFTDLLGSSKAENFEDHHDILSFSHNASRPGSESGDVGHIKHGTFNVTKMLDKATPEMWDFCNSNKSAEKVILKLVRLEGAESTGGDGERTVFMTYTLEGVRILSINVSGGGGGGAVENISFTYKSLTWTYSGEDGAKEAFYDQDARMG